MNADTGRIYYGEEDIEAAKARGERLIELSPGIVEALTEKQECIQALLSSVQRESLDEAMEKALPGCLFTTRATINPASG